MGTGKKWNDHEHFLACKSFVQASLNSEKGNGQNGAFHYDIEKRYAQLRDELIAECLSLLLTLLVRKRNAIAQRFKDKVPKECVKTEGFVKRIKAANPTGNPSEDDALRFAVALYSGCSMSKMYEFLRNPNRKSAVPCVYLSSLRYLRTTNM